jgi:hypothetical protein
MGGQHGKRDLVYLTAKKAAAVITDGQVLFTVSGGPVMFKQILGTCKTNNDATASTVRFVHTPTVGSATNISAASASLANSVAGATIGFGAAAVATTPAISATGYQNIADANVGLLTEGTVSVTVGVGPTTGTWEWVLVYEPLNAQSRVS